MPSQAGGLRPTAMAISSCVRGVSSIGLFGHAFERLPVILGRHKPTCAFIALLPVSIRSLKLRAPRYGAAPVVASSIFCHSYGCAFRMMAGTDFS
jgi:hypothetical protein